MKEIAIKIKIVDTQKLDDYCWSYHVSYIGGMPDVHIHTNTTFYVVEADPQTLHCL